MQTKIEQESISTIKRERTPVIETAEIAKQESTILEKTDGTTSPAPIIAVEVPAKPEFTVPLYDATIQEGERFTFECRVIGHPRPDISWQKDGIPIINNPDYQTKYGEDGLCTLTIEETFTEDSAKFSCKATNEAGSAESQAVLRVRGRWY